MINDRSLIQEGPVATKKDLERCRRQTRISEGLKHMTAHDAKLVVVTRETNSIERSAGEHGCDAVTIKVITEFNEVIAEDPLVALENATSKVIVCNTKDAGKTKQRPGDRPVIAGPMKRTRHVLTAIIDGFFDVVPHDVPG